MIRRLVTNLAIAAGLVVGLGAATASAGSEDGNFMIRLQGTYLDLRDKTKSATSSTLGDIKALGYTTEASNSVLPTATLTYFFNKNFAAELFCCFAKADVDLLSNGNKLGEAATTWVFPPIVTLQYHFTGMGAIKPYVGAGFQYIHYFSSKTGDNVLAADSVSFKDSFGPALQAGIDVSLGGGWYLNADVKKSWLDTKVNFSNAQTLGPHDVAVKHALDPLTVSLGIGYRFNLEDLLGGRRATSLK